MSKSSLFKQPGVEQLVPGDELPVGVKVTGRNMHAVTLLVSVAGETAKSRTSVTANFNEDGSLDHVVFSGDGGTHTVEAGQYLVLGDDKVTLLIADEASYNVGKAFLRSINELDKILAPFFGGLS